MYRTFGELGGFYTIEIGSLKINFTNSKRI